MKLDSAESIIRWAGALLASAALGLVFYGLWQGMRRQPGRTTGHAGALVRLPWFYLIASALFFAFSYLGWKPLPLSVSPMGRAWMLGLGSLLYFPGLAFTLWGRLALGKNYFVSTALGAQLFAGHQLVTGGPFAIVRHPMYVGLAVGALGGLLIYSTWTTLVFACFAPLLSFRARREERALEMEFGEQWSEYCQQVPAFVPLSKGQPARRRTDE